jgi:hypothetical protein
MNKTLLSLISFFFFVCTPFASSHAAYSEAFLVKSDPQCLLDKRLIAKDLQIGLLKLASNKKGTFYFFDDQNQLQNTFVLKRKDLTMLEFEVLDQYQKTIAYFDIRRDRTSGLVYSVALYDTADKKSAVLFALPGIFSIKDLFIESENFTIGKIRRHYIDLDSEINITDKQRFLSRTTEDLDINVLNAVLAFAYMPTKTLDVDLF